MRQLRNCNRSTGRELGRREGSAEFHSLIGPLDRPEAFGSESSTSSRREGTRVGVNASPAQTVGRFTGARKRTRPRRSVGLVL